MKSALENCCIGMALLCFLGLADARVSIEGVEGELRTNVLAHLSLDDEACDLSDRRLRLLTREAVKETRTALQALGYYRPSVDTQLTRDDTCWLLTLRISAGEPARIDAFDVTVAGQAADDAAFVELIGQSPLAQGAAFRHDHYTALKSGLLEVAARRGYADARLARHEVMISTDGSRADVNLQLESGVRYRFGEVVFEQDALEDSLVRGYLTFKPGDHYNSRRLTELYSALAASGFFERIQIEPQHARRADGQIPVRVALTPGKRKIYTAGVGYSTNTGPRFRAGHTNRRRNARGHQWGTDLLLSDVVSELTVNFRRPMRNPQTDWLSFDAGYKYESTDTSRSDAVQVGARLVVRRSNGWQYTRYVDFLMEDFTLADQADRSTLLIPGVSWLRSESDNRLHPQRGSRLKLEVQGSVDKLGSDATFLAAEAGGKWIYPLRAGTRALLRAEAGYIVNDDIRDLPPSVRFFAGGDASVRGYAFESIGTSNDNGDVIGGTRKLVLSGELEQQLTPHWSVAVFADAGDAFDSSSPDLKVGAGAGLRWLSPVGPVRLDLARPMDGDDRSLRIHLTFGPDL